MRSLRRADGAEGDAERARPSMSSTRNTKAMAKLLAMGLACNQSRVFNFVHTAGTSETYIAGQSKIYHQITHDEPTDASSAISPRPASSRASSCRRSATSSPRWTRSRKATARCSTTVSIMAFSDTGYAKIHSIENIPMFLAGGAGGRHKAGQHIATQGRLGDARVADGDAARRCAGRRIRRGHHEDLASDHRSHGVRRRAMKPHPIAAAAGDDDHRRRDSGRRDGARWTKTYVVEWNEPAMYYGAKSGVIDPGTDCPEGHESRDRLDQGAGRCRLHARGSAVAAQSGQPDTQPGTRPEPDGVPRQGSRERLCESDVDARHRPGRRVAARSAKASISTATRRPASRARRARRASTTTSTRRSVAGRRIAVPQRLSSGALQFNDSMRNGGWTTVIVVVWPGRRPDERQTRHRRFLHERRQDGEGRQRLHCAGLHVPHQAGREVRSDFPGAYREGRDRLDRCRDDVTLRDPGYTRDLELLRAQGESGDEAGRLADEAMSAATGRGSPSTRVGSMRAVR